jgi:G protein-coupled receptor Mth (Methuselah protein)
MLETRFHVNNKVLVIVLLICVIGSAEHTAVQLHKCCPDNYELITIDLGDAGKFFNCSAKTDASAVTDFFTHYNIRQDADQHIPECQTASDFYNFLVYDDLVTVGANTCFDMLDGNMLALSCQQQHGNFVSFNFELNKIYRMQKCCPMHQYYDPAERQCVQTLRPNSVQQLEDFMGDLSSSIFKIGAPKCSNNEALVEYRTDKHDLRIDNSSLYMLSYHNQSVIDRIFPNAFCADLVVDQSLSASQHWVVKVCQPQKVCNRIPCVRKCCGDGEFYYVVNGTKECRPYNKGLMPEFHDFLDNDGRVPVEPKGWCVCVGVFVFKKCGPISILN